MNILVVDDEVSALRQIEMVLKSVVPDAEVEKTNKSQIALEMFEQNDYDVVFLDIEMPGKNGLTLAKEFKSINSQINIIMLTAYPGYALDAIKLYVSDYIVKPALTENVRNALANLRNPINEKKDGLYVQCFGNFEVFYNGTPVKFRRAKAKELFAYLVDRRGASATNGEIRAVLWGDNVENSERQRNYFSQCARDLRRKFGELGCEEIFIQKRDFYAVVPELIQCDYYSALNKDSKAIAAFHGEYMSQYEWAEERLGGLTEAL